MTAQAALAHSAAAPRYISAPMTWLLACACGLIAASLYFAQPLVALIAADLHMPLWQGGLLVTFSQLGFCLGLLLLAPLGDLLENRRLVLVTLAGLCLALAATALAHAPSAFLLAALALGAGTTAVQMLVPMVAHMSRPGTTGRNVGNVTAGLLAGIMLARPVAGVAAEHLGWRGLFGVDAALVFGLALLLARQLPERRPPTPLPYRALIASFHRLLLAHPALRRAALAQACLFAAFSLFWTAAPLALAQRFGLGQSGIALFGLAAAGGALAAPLAGRASDRGHGTAVRYVALALVAAGFAASIAWPTLACWVLAALAIDAGVQLCHVTAQRTVLILEPPASGRMNSLYIATFFFGGAGGSALAAPLFALGWDHVALAGIALALVAAGLGGRLRVS